jgi:hypothetical protein
MLAIAVHVPLWAALIAGGIIVSLLLTAYFISASPVHMLEEGEREWPLTKSGKVIKISPEIEEFEEDAFHSVEENQNN